MALEQLLWQDAGCHVGRPKPNMEGQVSELCALMTVGKDGSCAGVTVRPAFCKQKRSSDKSYTPRALDAFASVPQVLR